MEPGSNASNQENPGGRGRCLLSDERDVPFMKKAVLRAKVMLKAEMQLSVCVSVIDRRQGLELLLKLLDIFMEH